jgi:hypothetical protein
VVRKDSLKEMVAWNKLKTHFNPENVSTLTQRERKSASTFISSHFGLAWDHQLDGNQTNVTLSPMSIKALVKGMTKAEILKDGCIFMDCGLSYGSLLLQVVNQCMNLEELVSIKGYSIESSMSKDVMQ